jgi:ketosteroid isomerase-like protein
VREAIPGIEALATAYVSAVLSNDAAGLTALYHSEAVQLPPGEPAVEGRTAIVDRFARSRSASEPGGPVSFWGFSWSVDGFGGDLAYDYGMYQFQVTYEEGDTSELLEGTYVVVLREEGGAWRIWREAWTEGATDDP